MNIKLYTAAREATSKARNVASAIQQAQRQVNDDNKDIKDKVDKNQQNRAKNKAKEELESAKVAKDLAAKQLSISQQQATAGAIQALGAVALSVVGAKVDKKNSEEKAQKNGNPPPQKPGGLGPVNKQNKQQESEKAKGGGILGKIKDAIKSVFGGGKGGDTPPVGDGGGNGNGGNGNGLGNGKGLGLGNGNGNGNGLGLGDGGGDGGKGGPGLGAKLKNLGNEFLDMGNSDEKYAGVEGKGNKETAKGVEGGLKLLQMGANPMMAANKLAGMADQGLRGLESKMGLGAFAEEGPDGKMKRTQAGESFANIMDTIGKLLGAKELDGKLAKISDTLKEIGNMFDNPNELGMLGKAVKAGLVDTFKATTQLAGAALTDVANAGTQAVQGGVDSASGRNGGDNGATKQTKQNETDRAKSLVDNAGTTTPGTAGRGDANPATPATTTLSADQEQQLGRDLRQLFSAGTEEGGRARSQQEIDALVNQGLDQARLLTLAKQLGIASPGDNARITTDDKGKPQLTVGSANIAIDENGGISAKVNGKDLQLQVKDGQVSINGVKLEAGIAERVLAGDTAALQQVQTAIAGLTGSGEGQTIRNNGSLTATPTEDENPIAAALEGFTANEDGSATKTVNGNAVTISKEDLTAFRALQASGANVGIGEDGNLTINGTALAKGQGQALQALQALGVNVNRAGVLDISNGVIQSAKVGINGQDGSVNATQIANAAALVNSGQLKGPAKLLKDGGIQLANGATIDATSLNTIAQGLSNASGVTLAQKGAASALLQLAQSGNGLSISGASLAPNGDLSVNGITVGANAVQVLAGNTARSGQDVTGSTVNRDVSDADKQLLVEAVRAGSFLSAATNDGQNAGIKVDLGGLNSDNSRVSLTAGGKNVSQSDLRAISSGNASLGTYQDILGDKTNAAGAVKGLLQSLGASNVSIENDNNDATGNSNVVRFNLGGRESAIQLNGINLNATDGGAARQLSNNQAFGAIRAVAQLGNNGLDLRSTSASAGSATVKNIASELNGLLAGKDPLAGKAAATTRLKELGFTDAQIANVLQEKPNGAGIQVSNEAIAAGISSAPAVTINRQGTVNINAAGAPQRTLDATSISRINGDTSGGVASSVATSIATGGQIEGNRSAGSFSNTRQALDNFKDVFGRIGSGVSGVFGPGKGNDSSNIPDSLKEGAVRDIGNVIDNATKGKSGAQAREAAVKALEELGFTPEQIDQIIPAKKNDKNEITGFTFSKSALSDNLSVSRASDGANGFTFSVSAAGNNSKSLGGLNIAANGTITAQGGSITTTDPTTSQKTVTAANFGLDFSGLAKNANNNRRDTIAQNLNNLLEQNGLGRSVVFADQIQLDAQGNLAGVRIDGRNLSIEEFAARALANPSGNTKFANAGQLADALRSQAGVALQRSSGALQNGGGGSDLANAATTALNNLRASGFNVEGATINFDAGNGKAQINLKDGKSLFVDDKGNFSNSAVATGNAAGNATLLKNTFGVETTGPELTKFNRNQDQIKRLTSAIEEGFQAKAFGLFGVTNSKVNNLQVGFDENGNINSARATLANGSEVAFNRIDFERGIFSIDKAASKGSEMLADPENTYLNTASQRTLEALRGSNIDNTLNGLLGNTGTIPNQGGQEAAQGLLNDLNGNAAFKTALANGNDIAANRILRDALEARGFDRKAVRLSDVTQVTNPDGPRQLRTAPTEDLAKKLGFSVQQFSGQGPSDKNTYNDALSNRNYAQVAVGGQNLRLRVDYDDTGRGYVSTNELSQDQQKALAQKLLTNPQIRQEIATGRKNDLAQALINNGDLKAALATGEKSKAQDALNKVLEAQGLAPNSVKIDDILAAPAPSSSGTAPLKLKGAGEIAQAASTAVTAAVDAEIATPANAGVTARLEQQAIGALNAKLGGGEQPVVQRGDQLTAERNVVEAIRSAFIARGGQLADFKLKFASTQFQDLVGQDNFKAGLRELTGLEKQLKDTPESDKAKRAELELQIKGVRARLDEFVKQANLNSGFSANAVTLDDLRGTDGLAKSVDDLKKALGSVNVTAGYDGRDARIDVQGVTFEDNSGNARKADFSITRNQRGGYSVNLDVDSDDGFGRAIQDQLGNRFSSDDGKEGWVSKVTKGLATGLNAAMPGIEYWRKGMEAIQEALIQLEAAKKQLAAALDYFAKMGLTPGMIVAGGDGAAAAPAGGGAIPGGGGPGPVTGGGGGNLPPGGGPGPVTGGGSGGGSNGPGAVDNGGGGDSSGGNGPGPVGEGDGSVDGANMDANGDGVVSEGEQMVGNSASSSAFENLAVNLGYMPGMLIQMAQEQGKLDELGELLVQLSQPDKINPIVAMIQFTQKLMADPNQLADAGAAALGG